MAFELEDVERDAHVGGRISVATYVILFVLKVSLAASVDTSEFQKRLTRRWPVFFGVLCQFAVSPSCGALGVWLLGIPFMPGVLLLVITSCPGGCFSNWLCQLVNGDLAMSVAMTGFSTLVGVAMLPINVYIYSWLLYSKEVLSSQQWYGIVLSVAIVLVALCIGLAISNYLDSQKWRVRFGHIGTVCGLLVFSFSAFESTNPETTTMPVWKRPWTFYAAVALPVLLTSLIMMVLTSVPHFGLQPPERVAVVIEAVYQNTALASATAVQLFAGRHLGDAMGLVVLYQLCQGMVLLLFGICAHYSHWTLASPEETSLCKALLGNFQQKAASHRLLTNTAKSGGCFGNEAGYGTHPKLVTRSSQDHTTA